MSSSGTGVPQRRCRPWSRPRCRGPSDRRCRPAPPPTAGSASVRSTNSLADPRQRSVRRSGARRTGRTAPAATAPPRTAGGPPPAGPPRATPPPARTVVDDPAEQPGPGQTGDGGQRVQREHGGEGPAVRAGSAAARPAGRRPDRRPGAPHRAAGRHPPVRSRRRTSSSRTLLGRGLGGAHGAVVVRLARRPGDQARGIRAARRGVRGGCRRPRPCRRPGSSTRSARSSSSGEVVVTTVVRPARAARSRAATAASVCASTRRGRLDGEQHLGVGQQRPGQADAAAAGRRRGCGPARRSARRARPAGRGRCPRPRPSRRARPIAASDGSRRPATTSRSVPANRSASWSATRIRSRSCAQRDLVEAYAAPGRRRSARTGRAGRPRPPTSAGRSAASAVSRPGGTRTPDAGSCSTEGSAGASRAAVVRQSGSRRRNRTTRRAATTPAAELVAALDEERHRHAPAPPHSRTPTPTRPP